MVEMKLLMNLNFFVRRGLWQLSIWILRSGGLMFNLSSFVSFCTLFMSKG